jgi:hypothetical protein
MNSGELTLRERNSGKRVPWPPDPMVVADRLDALQAAHNNGRGVSCVRSICFELRQRDLVGALAVCDTEGDKIRNYPDIVAVLTEVGLWWEIDFSVFGCSAER